MFANLICMSKFRGFFWKLGSVKFVFNCLKFVCLVVNIGVWKNSSIVYRESN